MYDERLLKDNEAKKPEQIPPVALDMLHAPEYKHVVQQHNRNITRRLKHEALTSIGLKRVKGALGGVYYE